MHFLKIHLCYFVLHDHFTRRGRWATCLHLLICLHHGTSILPSTPVPSCNRWKIPFFPTLDSPSIDDVLCHHRMQQVANRQQLPSTHFSKPFASQTFQKFKILDSSSIISVLFLRMQQVANGQKSFHLNI